MGWSEIYTRRGEKTRDIVTREFEGDPERCADCGWSRGSHPRVKGSEVAHPAGYLPPAPHAHAPASPVYRVLDYSQVGWSAAYLAVETIATGEVWAGICLLRRTGRSLYLKTLTETMGPVEDRCPPRILDRLSPTDDRYAREWRERCRARASSRARTRELVRPGDRLRFLAPLAFSDGVEADDFVYLKGSIFRRSDGGRVRITNWRDRAWQVVPA